ncbi:MAG: M1 family metallopeptidase [Bacteroidales bacterium]|nr:M1 family metallopeptidase [Bacteroidales bacterium]
MRKILVHCHLIWLFSILMYFPALSQTKVIEFIDDPNRFIPEKQVDFEHLTANIRINPISHLVKGNATFVFRQIKSDNDTLQLFTPSFKISGLTLDKVKIDYVILNDQLTILLPEKTKKGGSHTLSIDYETFPTDQLYFNGWDDTTNTLRKQIWAHRPAYWLPFANDRLTVDMLVTFDSKYKVYSNGVRESVVTNNDGTKTWHYKMYHNHPFFSTALVIGDYDFKSFNTPKNLPVELWYYPVQADHLEPTYQYLTEMIKFCEDSFGVPYPYELYREAPVVNYLYGAMETTTSTIFGDYLFIDERAYWERNYININVHELVHQWFGNYVSHLRNKDVWLTETFATYYAKMFEKSIFGEDYYQWERTKEYERTMRAAAIDNFGVGHSRGGSDRWYPKGSLILDMLHDVLGERDFQRSITAYLKKFAYDEAWTPDLIKTIHETTGQSIDWFFDQWIERGGEPHYQIEYEELSDRILVNVKQIQPISDLQPVFRMPVNYEVYFTDGSIQKLKSWNSTEYQQISIPKQNGQTLLFLLFDPGNRILKKTTFTRSNDFLLNQLAKAPAMIDRLEALKALKNTPVQQKREAYLQAANSCTFHLFKAEILNQLARDSTQVSIDFFRNCLTDKEPLTRRAALTQLSGIHKSLIPEIADCLKDTSYSNIVIALNTLANIDPNHLSSYLETTKNETGYPGKLVRIAWLQLSINQPDSIGLHELTDYASIRYEFMTRINAIRALTSLNCFNEVIAANFVEAATHWNTKLQPVAMDALIFFNRQLRFKKIIEKAVESQVTDLMEREKLMKKID